MEKEFIYVGSNVDAALKEGLKDLNLTEDEVKIEVLEAGSGGIFGLFKKEAKVRLTPLADDFVKVAPTIIKNTPLPKVEAVKSEDKPKVEKKEVKKVKVAQEAPEEMPEPLVVPVEVIEPVAVLDDGPAVITAEERREAKKKREDYIVKNKEKLVSYLENIVIAMGYADAKVDFREDGSRHFTMNIKTSEPTSLIIGKRGITLNSLQFLVNNYAKKFSSHYFRIEVDCDNYRASRKKTLEELALNLAKKSKKTGRPVELEPMNSEERKIIHNALTGIKNVETESRGEEPHRYLVITAK